MKELMEGVPSGVSLAVFDGLITDARTQFDAQQYDEAWQSWRKAANLAPTPLMVGVAIRGEAECAERLGDRNEAYARAGVASVLHDGTLVVTSTSRLHPDLMRQHGYSASVLGRIGLGMMIEEEMGRVRHGGTVAFVIHILHCLDTATRDLEYVEKEADTPDVYRVHALCDAAIGHALYGERDKAQADGNLAITLGQDRCDMKAGSASSPAPYATTAESVAQLTALQPSWTREATLRLAQQRFVPAES